MRGVLHSLVLYRCVIVERAIVLPVDGLAAEFVMDGPSAVKGEKADDRVCEARGLCSSDCRRLLMTHFVVVESSQMQSVCFSYNAVSRLSKPYRDFVCGNSGLSPVCG